MNPKDLQEEILGDSPEMKRRRAVIGLSLIGMAAMGAVSLLQTGVVKHLPDPPIKNFDSDKVNLSETAYRFGAPDGTISLAGLAANIPLAAFGGKDRASENPLVPLLAGAKAMIEAIVAGWFFLQMPTKQKAWCGYCIVGALCNWGIAALTFSEAKAALDELRGVSSSND